MCGLGAAYSNDYACGKATVLYLGLVCDPLVQKLVFRALLGPSMRVLGSLCVFGRNRFHRMVQMI